MVYNSSLEMHRLLQIDGFLLIKCDSTGHEGHLIWHLRVFPGKDILGVLFITQDIYCLLDKIEAISPPIKNR